jgi:hypothetical protein
MHDVSVVGVIPASEPGPGRESDIPAFVRLHRRRAIWTSRKLWLAWPT